MHYDTEHVMASVDSGQDDERTLASLGISDADPAAPPCAAERVHPDVDAVIYRGVLSRADCARFVAALQRGAGWRDKCAKKHVRDAEGVGCTSRELAALIDARIGGARGLPESWRERVVTMDDRHLGDIGTEGTWAARRVNARIRATRYRRGGHFAPHRDGVIMPRDGERSFLTVLAYLSDHASHGFDGGETAFVRDDSALEYGAFDAERDILARVAPEAGAVLVFTQDALHAGLPVLANDDDHKKFVLVSEVFYERTAEAEHAWDPVSVALLREAEEHEGAGDFQAAIKCYNRLRRVDPVFASHAGIP